MQFIKGRQFVTAFLYKQMNNIFKQININQEQSAPDINTIFFWFSALCAPRISLYWPAVIPLRLGAKATCGVLEVPQNGVQGYLGIR